MSWRVRHEGSPQSVDGLSLAQVAQGLQDGQWEPTDEVMGPEDRAWVPIEVHPQLAEVAADLEPPPAPHHDDETRLDMNALIDVTMVLLIFFILTMSYGALEKVLESGTLTGGGRASASRDEVYKTMIRVKLEQRAGRLFISMQSGDERRVDVPEDKLVETLRGLPREGKTALLIEHDYNVPYGLIVAVQDAAKSLQIEQVYYGVPKRSAGAP